MSIFENLLIPLYKSTSRVPGVRFIDWTALSDVFDWEVERLAIKTGPKSNPITSLSGGNQQKVIIGRSFALHPKILILNDPARGIDVDTKRELYKHLLEFAAEGNSVIYMSSELEEFIGFCSRVAVFRNGSIFKSYVDNEVEPVGILEGMFGRISGDKPATTNTGHAGTDGTSAQVPDVSVAQSANPQSNHRVATADDIRRIRIVEYEDHENEVGVKTEESPADTGVHPKPASSSSQTGKIKISYFD